jgi:hypothetical protein
MIAIRQIQEVKSGAVTVALPVDFHAKRVEIIVLPIEESNHGAQNLQDLLLSAPTLTDDESQEYEKVREWMSQWNVNGF